jgi:hypothetical protein
VFGQVGPGWRRLGVVGGQGRGGLASDVQVFEVVFHLAQPGGEFTDLRLQAFGLVCDLALARGQGRQQRADVHTAAGMARHVTAVVPVRRLLIRSASAQYTRGSEEAGRDS